MCPQQRSYLSTVDFLPPPSSLPSSPSSSHHRLLSKVSIEPSHLVTVLVHLVKLWMDLLLQIHNVLLQQILWKRLY